jgi:hypothetical protein
MHKEAVGKGLARCGSVPAIAHGITPRQRRQGRQLLRREAMHDVPWVAAVTRVIHGKTTHGGRPLHRPVAKQLLAHVTEQFPRVRRRQTHTQPVACAMPDPYAAATAIGIAFVPA